MANVAAGALFRGLGNNESKNVIAHHNSRSDPSSLAYTVVHQ